MGKLSIANTENGKISLKIVAATRAVIGNVIKTRSFRLIFRLLVKFNDASTLVNFYFHSQYFYTQQREYST